MSKERNSHEGYCIIAIFFAAPFDPVRREQVRHWLRGGRRMICAPGVPFPAVAPPRRTHRCPTTWCHDVTSAAHGPPAEVRLRSLRRSPRRAEGAEFTSRCTVETSVIAHHITAPESHLCVCLLCNCLHNTYSGGEFYGYFNNTKNKY